MSQIGYVVDEAMHWNDLELGTEVKPVNRRSVGRNRGRGKGQSGGRPTTPHLRCLPADGSLVIAFLSDIAAGDANTGAQSMAWSSEACPTMAGDHSTC